MKLIGTEGTDYGGMKRHVETPRKAKAPWSAPTSAGGPEGEVVL
ncbi:hypothetical protein [Bacillus sp. B-jedd]|nr:hypothetical protein [Bacillus sp. B-jedd]